MQFGGFHVDAVHRTVTSPSGRVTRLEPKAFDLLVYFADHPEETLSRERLVADVWGGKFVTDDAVQVAVYALRQAFGDDSKAPRFIETIRGRGYRWIAAADDAGKVDGAAPTSSIRLSFAAIAALFAVGFAAIVWGVLRPPMPMPSMTRTSAIVRAHARGVFFSERTTRKDLEQARTEFRKAIALDDRFAEPHAALAEVCVRLVEIGTAQREARETEARREVKRALQLAPQLAITHAALASVQFVLDRDLQKAERSFLHALELDPSLPDIHRRYSYLLGASGRFAQAAEQARIATEMAPASAGAMNDYAWTLILSGDLTGAERAYRDAVRLDPAGPGELFALGFCLDLEQRPREAMDVYRRAMQMRGIAADVITRCDRLFATGGLPAMYAEWLRRLEPSKDVPRFLVAFYAARSGNAAAAMHLLRESAQHREPGALWVAVHPAFASLHNQREFAAVVASSFQTR